MTERNYRNYSEEHYAAAAAFAGTDGNCSMSAALYHTQSTLPDSTRIQDDVELLYPHRIQPLNVEEIYPTAMRGYSYAPRKNHVQNRQARIHKDGQHPPSFIWDLSGGGLPRGKAYRKLIKRETDVYIARVLGVKDDERPVDWGNITDVPWHANMPHITKTVALPVTRPAEDTQGVTSLYKGKTDGHN